MEPISCWPPEEASSPELQEADNDYVGQHKRQNTCDNIDKPDSVHPTTKKPRPTLTLTDPDEVEPRAHVTLARWWRSKGQHLIQNTDLRKIKNPNTFLKALLSETAAREFLSTEISRLRSRLVGAPPVSASDINAALATFLESLGQLKHAAAHISDAQDLCPHDNEIKWLNHKIQLQLKIKQQQQSALDKLKSSGEIAHSLQKPTQVDRVPAKDLTVEDFKSRYAEESRPVIITGLVRDMTSVPWSLDHIGELAGDRQVTLKRLVPGSSEWAQLEPAETTTVSAFLDSLQTPDPEVAEESGVPADDRRYLFDWSLPLHCPQLAAQITLPKYFQDNLLTRTSPGTLYRDSWPSLFVAPAGLRSELHVDAFGSNFWMALFEGRKRWVFFPVSDLPHLYPAYPSHQSTDPVFDVNLRDPDFSKHPLLSLASPRECVLEPGELLFVPAGCPHYVENLEKSLAVSANVVDESNWWLARMELVVNSLLDERSRQLLEQLNRLRNPKSESDVQDEVFGACNKTK